MLNLKPQIAKTKRNLKSFRDMLKAFLSLFGCQKLIKTSLSAVETFLFVLL